MYIDGKLDSLKRVSMVSLEKNNYDLFIGGHPSYFYACKIYFSIETFKIYS